MTFKHPILTLASAAALTLTLAQPVLAEGPAAAAPAEAAPPAPTLDAQMDARRADMERRWAAAMAAREAARQAYLEEYKKRMGEAAGEPSAAAEPQPPMTPEDYKAAREQRWQQMRERAAQRGIDLPETPPWVAAEQRRKELLERYNAYRAIIEAMTDEQKEAIAALFGNAVRGPRGPVGGWAMPPEMPEMPEMPEPPAMPPMPGAPDLPAPPAAPGT